MNTRLKPADIELPKLPWAENALEPTISGRTIHYHYDKHHRGYVDKLNKAIGGTPLAGMPLKDLVRSTAEDPELRHVFDLAAQVWNHSFYWNSLAPQPNGPSGDLAKRLEKDFGGVDKFREQFGRVATSLFGSGWAWLVYRDGRLQVETTRNAMTPMAADIPCLLTLDVWEHAYYLDYQHDRAAHVRAVIDNLLDWTRADSLFRDIESA